jgi:glycosyltransferase involved in cell wall biosynthesis
VVLLAHNAGAHLGPVVQEWLTYLAGLKRDYELLLVDDGSTDQTGAQAAALAERFPCLTLLRHERRLGEGAALRTGVGRARYPLLFYAPCDPRYCSAHLNLLLCEPLAGGEGEEPRPLIDTVHLTTGYHAGFPAPLVWRITGLLFRFLCRVLFNAAPTPRPGWLGWRQFVSWFVCRVVFGIRNRDVTCPVRLLRREILQRVPLQSDGCFVHAEMLAKANFLTLLLSDDIPLGDWQKPVPPLLREGPAGQMWKDGWRVFWTPDFGPSGPPASGIVS